MPQTRSNRNVSHSTSSRETRLSKGDTSTDREKIVTRDLHDELAVDSTSFNSIRVKRTRPGTAKEMNDMTDELAEADMINDKDADGDQNDQNDSDKKDKHEAEINDMIDDLAEADLQATSKPPPKTRTSKKWELPYVVTDPKSPLATINLLVSV
jgi:hypothetical protein